MPDRTINFGESETEATYQMQDTDAVDGGGNFVLAKDTNANTVLLEYDPATDTWTYVGDVDMNGGDVSGVGTLTADSVNTENADIGPNVTGITEVVQMGAAGKAKASDRFSLPDDATTTIISGGGSGNRSTIIWVQTDAPESAIFTQSGGSTAILDSVGSFANSDSDGNSCVFNSNGDIILKNRTGGPVDYDVLALGIRI